MDVRFRKKRVLAAFAQGSAVTTVFAHFRVQGCDKAVTTAHTYVFKAVTTAHTYIYIYIYIYICIYIYTEICGYTQFKVFYAYTRFRSLLFLPSLGQT